MVRGWVIGASLLVSTGAINGQAANSLSDAGRSVFQAFPHATSFRSIVRDVDQNARREVEQRLPFKVHFNELGPHALYVPFREFKPIGLLYVRTEDGGWGFSKIGWSLSLDLRINGFRVLRSRSRHRFALQRSPFARSMVGLGYEDLTRLLDKDGKLVVKPGDVPKGSEKLALALVRSAMKTILVTRTVWRKEIDKLRDRALGIETFKGARAVVTVSIPQAKLLQGKRVQSVRAVRVFGTGRICFGLAAQTVSSYGKGTVTLRWALTPDLRVLRVSPMVTSEDAKGDARLRTACAELSGWTRKDPGHGIVVETARELTRVLQPPRKGTGK